jgi:uncharacterized membrane protein YfcA
MFGSIDPLYSLSGFFVGLLVGQAGMGGGALMTPLLILLFGVHPATAVGTDLLYASATKTIGTLVHGLNQTVQWRIVTLLAMGSVPTTALTLLVISKLDLSGGIASTIIASVLGGLLLLTSLSLFFRRQFLAFAGTRLLTIEPKQTTLLTVLTGAVLGVLVTISSVGAGALGVTRPQSVSRKSLINWSKSGCLPSHREHKSDSSSSRGVSAPSSHASGGSGAVSSGGATVHRAEPCGGPALLAVSIRWD